MEMFSLSLNMRIYRSIGGPGQEKDVVDVLNAKDKRYLRQKNLSKIITTTCEGLGMLHYSSNK